MTYRSELFYATINRILSELNGTLDFASFDAEAGGEDCEIFVRGTWLGHTYDVLVYPKELIDGEFDEWKVKPVSRHGSDPPYRTGVSIFMHLFQEFANEHHRDISGIPYLYNQYAYWHIDMETFENDLFAYVDACGGKIDESTESTDRVEAFVRMIRFIRRTEQNAAFRALMLPPDILRVGGEQICGECNKPYHSHPFDQHHLSDRGQPFLRIGCDGQILKL